MKALIVGVKYPRMNYDVDDSLNELKQLCNACKIEVSKTYIQKVDKINPSFFIGKGKVQEIKNDLDNIDMVIFDEELTPLQVKELTDELDIEVTDRTDLILRIFESRAQSKEARLQVEIAKGQYLLPRLAGMKEELYSQQGGSGFRGSGEKQIELDRRVISRQINQARKQLIEVVKQRQIQRKRRKDNSMKVICLVGYTNSGKSSLMNYFCLDEEKKVLQKDMLFATLQTTTRRIKVNHHTCLLSDTVGFIERLPHHLVQAFRSTLEEVIEADLLIHVVDSSNDDYQRQIDTTNEVLRQIGVKDTPMIYAYNKVDLNKYAFVVPEEPYVFISATKGMGLDLLQDKISSILFKDYVVYQLLIPYDEGEVFKYLHQHCLVLEFQYLENNIYMKIEAHPSFMKNYYKYLMQN